MFTSQLQHSNEYLEGLGKQKILKVTLILSLVLGIFDFLLGPQLSFSVFYTIPIMLAVWYGGKWVGLLLAVVSAGVWLGADLASGNNYNGWFVPIWNTLVRLAYFLIIMWLLAIVRQKLELEQSLADTDPLTGLANRRFFEEQLDREYARLSRYPEPLTIAYFDLDNFKHVNDTMGHAEGDELLKTVAESLIASIRSTDFAARLGGDEFAVMFPMLQKESAEAVLEKLPEELLAAMQREHWPVTFSIGAVTFSEVMDSSRDMLKQVDNLMYEVKKSGKNNIRHLVWP